MPSSAFMTALRTARRLLAMAAIALGLLGLGLPGPVRAAEGDIHVLQLDDIINPISVRYVQRGIRERSEQLATSDKGVILIRKIIRNAVEAVQKGETPKGIPSKQDADKMIQIDSFTGIRAKGA